MKLTIVKSASLGTAMVLGAALLASAAFADGLPGRGRVAAPDPAPRTCALSANVGLTTDYVFRGFSQTAEGPAIQGGFDATCGLFYAGIWASNVDFGAVDFDETVANVEVDFYAGIKPTTGPVSWDLGVLYYTYPEQNYPFELNYVEIKVGASAEVWKGGTLGATVFYSPDYTAETGDVWTVEGSISQALPNVGMFSPTVSALLGYQTGGDDWSAAFANGDDSYLYWNAGLTLGFLEKWSLDLRYWDTDISNAGGFCDGTSGIGDILQCDSRFVATLKFTY